MNTSSIPRDSVVVGVDGSRQATMALLWAADRAEITSSPLHLLQAEGPWWTPYDLPPDVLAKDTVCAEALDLVRRDHPGIAVTCSRPATPPVPALLGASIVAREIVLGTRGMGSVRGAVLGSVTTQVSAAAQCPVIVVRGTSVNGKNTGPVVVGVDARPDGVAALDFAFEDAARRHVPLVAVLAWQLDRWDFACSTPVPRSALLASEQFHQSELEQALVGPATRHPGVEVTTVIECAATAGSLTHHSANASLLVVGTRGHRELTGFVLGSVSQAMMRRSACPVAVVAARSAVDDDGAHRERATTSA